MARFVLAEDTDGELIYINLDHVALITQGVSRLHYINAQNKCIGESRIGSFDEETFLSTLVPAAADLQVCVGF
jgi:hypothetical protein